MNQHWKTFLDLCMAGNLPQIVQYLNEGQLVTSLKDRAGTTALHLCAANGWTEAVSILIKSQTDLDSSNFAGWTPLMHAARNGHSAVVEQLILAGANTAARNTFGWDALSMAVTGMDIKTINILVPLARLSQLSQALVISCQVGCTSSTQVLMKHHVDVNFQLEYSGVTPLMLAASEGHNCIIQTLLTNGANPDIRNAMDMTALDVAISCGHKNVEETLALVTNKHNRIPILIPPAASDFSSTPVVEGSTSCFGQFISVSAPLIARNYPLSPGPYFKVNFEKNGLLSPYNLAASEHYLCLSPSSANNIPLLTPGINGSLFNFPSSGVSCTNQNYVYHSPSSELYPSSPMIPGWIFSVSSTPHNCSPSHALQQVSSVPESNDRLWKWWRKIKRRCKGKHHNVRVCKSHKFDSTSRKQLKALLKTLRLQTLLPVLQSHEVDQQTFLGLSDTDLRELGVHDDAFRAEVLLKIKELNGQ